MKKVRLCLLVLVLLLLTGCSGEIAADLYLQDIMDVVETEEREILTTAVVTVPHWGRV